MTVPVTPDAEPSNDRFALRSAVIGVIITAVILIGCATWLAAVDKPAEVTWALAGVPVGALATLATTRLGGTRPQ